MRVRRLCVYCKYAPGGHPWSNPGRALLWCGTGKRLVRRGDTCSEWTAVDPLPRVALMEDWEEDPC